MSKFSIDKFENGIEFFQDEELYKFTSDSIKLAKFCNISHKARVLDMCAGSGVVGIYAYSLSKFNKLYLNEIQSSLCQLIDKNIQHNNLQDVAQVLNKDLNLLTTQDIGGLVDVIVCNPPYFKVGEGGVKLDENIAICRHEIKTTLRQIIMKSSELLKDKGKMYLVLPASRMCEAISLLSNNKLEVKRISIEFNNQDAKICLIEAVKGGKVGVKITKIGV